NRATRLYRFTFVLFLTLSAIAAFVFVVHAFILDILMAAIFAGMLHPLLRQLDPSGKHRGLTIAALVAAAVLAVALPILIVVAIVGSETIQMSERSVAFVRQSIANPEPLLAQMPDWIANSPWLQSAIDSARSHFADIVAALSGFLSRRISSITHVTLFFLLNL